ncbi:uncharacterized protein K460DRAFT_362016 [Cucurbitaria berberidis CBS 394.84]|uniref:Uncharacterized protein n=1 Tax=Cucurbitaria berberidis CBS 394.84 TaxID=1168544 RepID=A0A9P4GT42_9PLEO|nr:uncharacterized protein K460DRAFT_362016 [Cucurbitaria berberidis CBS 394.84]KAF1851250.1 hypothetical protein K460DRAFT_362016 [Cucurbitaria berberidis CBS 394.84]
MTRTTAPHATPRIIVRAGPLKPLARLGGLLDVVFRHTRGTMNSPETPDIRQIQKFSPDGRWEILQQALACNYERLAAFTTAAGLRLRKTNDRWEYASWWNEVRHNLDSVVSQEHGVTKFPDTLATGPGAKSRAIHFTVVGEHESFKKNF